MRIRDHKTRPDLLRLLKASKNHVMTPEERRAQRRSWVRGEMLLEHPEMTAEEVDDILAKIEETR